MMSETNDPNNPTNPSQDTQNPLHGSYSTAPQAPVYMTVPLSQLNIPYNIPESYSQTVVPLEGPQIASPQIPHPLHTYHPTNPGNQTIQIGYPVQYPPIHYVQNPQYIQGYVAYPNHVPQQSVFNNNHLRVLERPPMASQQPAIIERIWSSGLFECLRDEESGWWSFWCCCLIDSRNVGEFGLNEQPSPQLIPGQPPSTKPGAERWLNSYLSLILLIFFFFLIRMGGLAILALAIGGVLSVYYRAKNRTEIRRRLGINRNPANSPPGTIPTNTTVSGSFESDFFNHCCCTSCTVAQESRESLATQNRQFDYCSGEAMGEVQTILSQGRSHVRSVGMPRPNVEMTTITSQPASAPQPAGPSSVPVAATNAAPAIATHPETSIYTYKALLAYIYSHRISRASQRLLQGFACFIAFNIFLLIISANPLGFVIICLIFLQPAIIFYLLLFKVIYPAVLAGKIYNEDSSTNQTEGDVETSSAPTSPASAGQASLLATYEPVIPYLDYTIKIFFVGFFISTFQSVIFESILQLVIGFIGVILFLLTNGHSNNATGGDASGAGNYLLGGGLTSSFQVASEGFSKLWTPVITNIAPNHRYSFWSNLFSTSSTLYASSPIYNFLVDYKGFRSHGIIYNYLSSIPTAMASSSSVITNIYSLDAKIFNFFTGLFVTVHTSTSSNAAVGSALSESNAFRDLHKAFVQQLYSIASVVFTVSSTTSTGSVDTSTVSYGSSDIYLTSTSAIYNPYSPYIYATSSGLSPAAGATDDPSNPNSEGGGSIQISPHVMRQNIILLLFLSACFAFIVAAGVEETMKHFAFRCCRFPSPSNRSSANANQTNSSTTTSNTSAITSTPRTQQNTVGNYISTISNSSYLKDPYKILLYMVAGAVGFETSENIEYVFGAASSHNLLANFLNELMVLGLRVCMPVHAICAVLQAVNLSKVVLGFERMNLIRVMLPALILHGSFDYFLFAMGIIQVAYEIQSISLDILSLLVPFCMGIVGALYAYRSFKKLEAQYNSSWRPLENIEDSSHPNTLSSSATAGGLH